MRKDVESLVHLQLGLVFLSSYIPTKLDKLTVIFLLAFADAGNGNQYLVDNRKHAFTADPLPILPSDVSVVKGSGLIRSNCATVDVFGSGDFIRTEVLEA